MRISDWSSDVCFSDLGITLEEQLFIERGAVASHVAAPPIETNVFRGRLFWLGREPLVEGARYQLRLGSLAVEAAVQQIERVFDIDDLSRREGREVPRHGVADVILRTRQLIAVDRSDEHTSELQSLMRNPYAVFCLK